MSLYLYLYLHLQISLEIPHSYQTILPQQPPYTHPYIAPISKALRPTIKSVPLVTQHLLGSLQQQIGLNMLVLSVLVHLLRLNRVIALSVTTLLLPDTLRSDGGLHKLLNGPVDHLKIGVGRELFHFESVQVSVRDLLASVVASFA